MPLRCLTVVRVALIRGPNLNPWELVNFESIPGVNAFGSRASIQPLDGGIEVRRLLSPADLLRPMPTLARDGVLRFAGSLDYLVGLERALRGYDIAHVAELANPYSLQAIRARRAGACRRVVATVWENIPMPPAANPLVARRARAVAAGLDACIAISADARLHLELAGVAPERIEVLPMGIDLERFAPAQSRADAGPLRILSVCRLVSEKGVEDLVVALRLLRDRDVAAQITLVGSGPLESRLREMAARLGVGERLRLLGGVPYAEVPALLGASDVFVLASAPRATWREQFGFAVVEAMAAGLPVLAGHSGSLDEVVGDPAALVTPHDPGELAGRLAQLAADPGLRRERGAANRARAEERYDRRRVSGRIAELYERVLALPARR